MGEEQKDVLVHVFAEILEQLAFMFAEPPEGEVSPPTSAALARASMGFKGPFEGKMEIVVPRDMCEELAANVLGLEPDDEMVQRAPFDALKELLNVTCGNVLTTIAGDEPVFDLTIPEVEELDPSTWPDMLARPGTVCYLVEDYAVLLHLESNG